MLQPKNFCQQLSQKTFSGPARKCINEGVLIFPAGKGALRRKPQLHIYIRNSIGKFYNFQRLISSDFLLKRVFLKEISSKF